MNIWEHILRIVAIIAWFASLGIVLGVLLSVR